LARSIALLHGLQQRALHLDAADPIEQHLDLHAGPGALDQRVDVHAGPGALDQRVDELAADASRPVNAGLEGHRRRCRADRRQHRRDDLVAVDQRVDLVALDDRRAPQRAERAPEFGVVGLVQPGQLRLDLLLAGGQVLEQQQPGQRAAVVSRIAPG
jgi:hypothetical protein